MGGRGYEVVYAQGNTGHDEADSGRPIKVGGKATTGTPTAVSDADRVDGWFDEYGRLHVISDTTINAPVSSSQGPLSFTITNDTAEQTLVAEPATATPPTAQTYINVQSIFVSNGSSTNVWVKFLEGAGGSVRLRGMVHKDGGGFVWTADKQQWQVTDGAAGPAALVAVVESSVDSVQITVMFSVGT